MLIDCVFSFDDIWEPSEKDNPDIPVTYDKDPVKIDITKEDVPPALLMKVRLPRLGFFPENRKKTLRNGQK